MIRQSLTVLMLLVGSCLASPPAQALTMPTNTWVVRTTPAFPNAIGAPSKHVRMTYDTDRRLVYFWGGDYCVVSPLYPAGERCASHEEFWSYNVATDTWALLLNQTQANTAGDPRGVCVAAFAYDPVHKVVWMTGGEERYDQYNSALVSGGLWAFNPTTPAWSKEGPAPDKSPAETPNVSSNEVMWFAYNGVQNELLTPCSNGGSGGFLCTYGLTGVTVNDGHTNDTWTARTGIDAANVEQQPWAIDTKRNRAILYSAYYHETWAYNLGTRVYTKLSTQTLPMKDSYGLVYDSAQDVVVAFGGFDNFQGSTPINPLNALWVLNLTTNTWSQPTLSGTISPRHGDQIVYDVANDVIMVFGGTGGWQDPGVVDSYGYYGTEIFLLRLNLGGGGGDMLPPAPPTNLHAQ